jgi:hypothetical protein
MSHMHALVEQVEHPVMYKVTTDDGITSVQWLYLNQVEAYIEMGYTVKEMR